MFTPRLSGYERFVGIDASLTDTGLVVLDGDGHALDVHAVRPPAKLRALSRLRWIRAAVKEVLHVYDHEATLVMIEGYGFGAKQSHSHSLGELGGVLKLAIDSMDFDGVVAPPSVLKKFATGKGNAPKDAVKLGVYKRWKFEHKDNNVVDAYALARLAMVVASPRTKAHQDLIKTVEGWDTQKGKE